MFSVVKIPHGGIQFQRRITMPCEKHTHRTKDKQKKLINRLSRIEGQIRGIKSMVENDIYCNDILIQTSSVIAALNSFNKELISDHMRSCVVNELKEGNEEIIDELVVTLQKLMK